MPLRFFAPSKPGPVPAFRRALQGSAVDDDGGGLAVPRVLHTGEHPQIVSSVQEASSFEPTVRLLAHRLRRRKVVREVRPLRTRAGHPQQRIQHGPDRVFPLSGILTAEHEIREQEQVCVVIHIAGVALPLHPGILPIPESSPQTSNVFLAASKRGELSDEQRELNRLISKVRITAENAINRQGKFRACKEFFRNHPAHHGVIWGCVAGLVNLRWQARQRMVL